MKIPNRYMMISDQYGYCYDYEERQPKHLSSAMYGYCYVENEGEIGRIVVTKLDDTRKYTVYNLFDDDYSIAFTSMTDEEIRQSKVFLDKCWRDLRDLGDDEISRREYIRSKRKKKA